MENYLDQEWLANYQTVKACIYNACESQLLAITCVISCTVSKKLLIRGIMNMVPKTFFFFLV